jgi:general secretion pathway protein E
VKLPTTLDSAKFIGEWLQQRTGLSLSELEACLAEQREKGGLIGDILVEKGAVTERDLMEALAHQLNLPFLDLVDPGGIDPEILSKLSVPFLLRHKIVPARYEDGRLLVATCDPMNFTPVDALSTMLGLRSEPALATEPSIQSAIGSLYEREEHSARAMMDELDVGDESNGMLVGEELDLSHEAPIIRLVNRMIYQAVRDRASDIHWETFENDMRVRLRVDGILHDVLKLDKSHHMAVTSRLKVMAGLDIAERRLPQDGRIKRKVGDREIDIRVSSVPTIHGERIVLRLLDRSSILRDLEDVGFSSEDYETFSRLIRLAHGIILVTGPTGSGKTTTLYAAIQKLRSNETNIMTIEDPVEYQLDGIAQMQMGEKAGFTFANGLRSILRQDPDVILVGEIRDRETAEVAIHASLTGHLVFSTLHTNDAVGAVTRLLEMGVEPFLISSSLRGVLAQRLVRRICPHCAEPASMDTELLGEIGIGPEEMVAVSENLRRGKGCPLCYHTGYQGRTGIGELLEIDDQIRKLINAASDAGTLRAEAIKNGMTSLMKAGGGQVAQGITTPEEVVRIIRA